MPAWSDYQEEAAEFFRSLGLQAETNVGLTGARTTHDIDVLVTTDHVGFELRWIVECKRWNRPVSKLHVLALREIVSDLGVDRGVLLAEAGFQSGAFEAAQLTNVQLTTLADLRITASDAVGMVELNGLQVRLENCKRRYWDMSKRDRIKYGLRPDVFTDGYSGTAVIEVAETALYSAFRGSFPVEYGGIVSALHSSLCLRAKNPAELSSHLAPHLAELEQRLDSAEAALRGPDGAS